MVHIWNCIRADFPEELIVHVEIRRFLYDKTKKNYKNILTKENTWEVIGRSLA